MNPWRLFVASCMSIGTATMWNELYCACSTSIYRVRMNVRGNQVAYMRMSS
jgi:hypothetical protein